MKGVRSMPPLGAVKKHCVFFYGGLNNEGRAKHAPSGGRKFVQTRAEDKLVWTMPSAAEFGKTQ